MKNTLNLVIFGTVFIISFIFMSFALVRFLDTTEILEATFLAIHSLLTIFPLIPFVKTVIKIYDDAEIEEESLEQANT